VRNGDEMNATGYAQIVCNAVDLADVKAYRYVPLGKYKVCIACPVCSCGRRHSITLVRADSEADACDLTRRRHLREVHGCEE
jgi:hypothetical protein